MRRGANHPLAPPPVEVSDSFAAIPNLSSPSFWIFWRKSRTWIMWSMLWHVADHDGTIRAVTRLASEKPQWLPGLRTLAVYGLIEK